MKLLIDSHVLIWLLYDSRRLNDATKGLLESADSVGVSMASLWELAVKYSKGKLKYSPVNLYNGTAKANIDVLPIKSQHVLGFPDIKLPHADPFDQLLIAQSESEGCSFVTADKQLLKSKYRTIVA